MSCLEIADEQKTCNYLDRILPLFSLLTWGPGVGSVVAVMVVRSGSGDTVR